MRRFFFLIVAALLAALIIPQAVRTSAAPKNRTINGKGNNLKHLSWGESGTTYLRIAEPAYADGISSIETGPSPRSISNRIFNDLGQNIFSENNTSQWGWAWGQFMDHDFGLRDETAAQSAPIPFTAKDPLESFTNDLGRIDFARTPQAPGTGTTTPRQQVNSLTSFIDGSGVYGVTDARLEWLRAGPVDGNLADNGAGLLLPGGYLPTAAARGDAKSAPATDLFGALNAFPSQAVIAGDVRANENIALTAIHTLFAREHNRIVAALPANLPAETKFEIARRILGAEEQYITYTEFLPALGVQLPAYRGYNPTVNPGLSNEFATVGYRAHSMIHGQFDVAFDDGQYTAAQLRRFRAEGIGLGEEDGSPSLQIPLTVAFGNPRLLPQVGLGPLLKSLGAERQYRNDEQIDNTLRSVLFEVPKPGVSDPSACQEPVVDPRCFRVVQDLGAIDIQRARDHGMPLYNDMRRAYGLAPKTSFTAITGESTDSFPNDPTINYADPIDDPNILDFVKLLDKDGTVVAAKSSAAQEDVVTGIRRTTLAARLKAIYGSVDRVDAFVGMMSEQHVPGTEFGELQLAMWRRQFAAIRDGDRFFYLNDPVLKQIARTYGVTYTNPLAQIIKMDTGTTVQADVFKAVSAGSSDAESAPVPAPAPKKHVSAAAAPEAVLTRHVTARAAAARTTPDGSRTSTVSAFDLRRRTASPYHRRA
ncbi:MAG: peroxidase [Actinobacteria bacterium]|nr:MAG: peroxidase [Actinomycetota bacterium]